MSPSSIETRLPPASPPPSVLPLDEARSILPDIVALRRRIHRRPETGLDLPETQRLVVEELERLGLEPRLGTGLSSVTAVIGGDRPGRTVILRAEMDALPLTEVTGLEFTSELDGAMHACGHDMHVAMLLGAARLLVQRARLVAEAPDALPGPVLLMFQPGEENLGGARMMLEEGLLAGLDRASTRGFALHISTLYPTGQVHIRPGTLLASADNVVITVHGRGGHASTPHVAADPIPVAAEIVLALQVAIGREVDVFDPVVLTIGHLAAGTTFNIIPESATLEGTYRCVSEARRAAMPALIRRVVDGVATAHGRSAEVRVEAIYPPTVNDPEVAARVVAMAEDLVGRDEVRVMPVPNMPAEDWAFVLQRIPGAMAILGGRPRDQAAAGYPLNHSNRVVFDEGAMAVGAALYTKAALEL